MTEETAKKRKSLEEREKEILARMAKLEESLRRNRAQQSRDRQNTSQKTAYDITYAMRLSFLQRANRLNSLRLRCTRFRWRTRPCHTSSNVGIAFKQSSRPSPWTNAIDDNAFYGSTVPMSALS